MNPSSSLVKSTNRLSHIEELLHSNGKIYDFDKPKKSRVPEPKLNTKNRVSKTPTKKCTNLSQTSNPSPSILPPNFRLDSWNIPSQKCNASSSNCSTFFEASSANDSPEVIFDSYNQFECDSTTQNVPSKSEVNGKDRNSKKPVNSALRPKKVSVKELTERRPRSNSVSAIQSNRGRPRTITNRVQQSQELFSSDDLSDDVQFICHSKAVLPSPDKEPQQHKNTRRSLSQRPRAREKSTTCEAKSLRYPLRNITTISPVIYDLPECKPKRRNSLLVVNNSPQTMMQMKPRICAQKQTQPRCSSQDMLASFQLSQDNYVYDSLENLGESQSTCDMYEFLPSPPSTPSRPQKAPTKKKNQTSQLAEPPQRTSKLSATKNTNQSLDISSTVRDIPIPFQFRRGRPPKNVKLVNSNFIPEKLLTKPVNVKAKSQSNDKVSKPKPTKVLEQSSNSKKGRTPRKPNNVLKDIKNTIKATPRNAKIPEEISSSSDLNTSAGDDDLSQQFFSISIDRSASQISQKSRKIPFFSFNSLNSTQSLFNPKKDNSQNFNRSYGDLLTRIDSKNHTDNETEMLELCELFSLLKIEDRRARRHSFLNYRDPSTNATPYTTRKIITKIPSKVPLKESKLANFPRSLNLSQRNTTISLPPKPFQKPVLKQVFHSSKIDLPMPQDSSSYDDKLDVSSVLRNITHIERKIPHYFYEDYNVDGFDEWN